ncbi:disulfide bond formation protein B [Mammaliicoccus sciuri]|uniref:disulfide bond formation protein B n=1 Tax=Mammaliicoccus sciuri TaxID=1296 RepID=UPI0034DDADB3
MSLTLLSIIGSIFVSSQIGISPCLLCLIQRFLMIVIFLLVLISFKINNIKIIYIRILSLLGCFISGYHYYIQKTHFTYTPCSLTKESCSNIEFEFLNFITMPLLSLIAFLLIFILSFRNEYN